MWQKVALCSCCRQMFMMPLSIREVLLFVEPERGEYEVSSFGGKVGMKLIF